MLFICENLYQNIGFRDARWIAIFLFWESCPKITKFVNIAYTLSKVVIRTQYLVLSNQQNVYHTERTMS